MYEILVRNKLQIVWNSFYKDLTHKKWRKLLGILGSAFLFWIMLEWIQDVFQLMLQTDLLPGTVSNRIELFSGSISLIFNALFLFLLMGGISISVHYLYTSADLTLLLATPLSLSAVFSFKIFETIFVNTGIFFLIGGAILIGQGLLIDASFFYYLNMLVVGVLFISLPTMLAIFLTLGIVRLLPAQRIRELSSALTGLIGLGLWLIIQFFRISLVEQTDPAVLADRTSQILHYSRLSQQFWTPGQLISDFTIYYLNPIQSYPWISIIGLFGGALLLYYLCLNFSVRQYLKSGTITTQTLLIKHVSGRRIKINSKRVPSFTKALIWKDLKLILRNPQISIQFLLMMAMIVFISLMMPAPAGQQILTVNLAENAFGYFFFLFILVSARNASQLVPLEGKVFWLLRILPAKTGHFLWSKYLLGFLLNQAIASIILVGITAYHQLSVNIFVQLYTLSILSNLSATSIGILMGSYYPKFDWEHPKRMLTSTGSLLVTGLSILYFLLIMLLEYLFQDVASNLKWSKAGLLFTSLLLWNLIFPGFVLKASAKKLSNMNLNI